MASDSKPRSPWYVRSFGDLYPLIYSHRSDDQAEAEVRGLFRALELDGTEAVLDLCCGAGRHMEAALSLGYDVTGFDLSPQLLVSAQDRGKLGGRLVRGDMRRLPFPECFDLVLNLFSSFGYFEKDGENEAALCEMARVLRPGGQMVLDHINKKALEKAVVPESVETRNGMTITQRRRIEKNRIVKRIEVKTEDGTLTHLEESVRLFEPDEIVRLAERCGLRRRALLGSFDGEAFSPSSPRMILVTKKGDPD